jgi:hypothetical protein
MANELIIGIGGIVLSVLTYFAGVCRTERRFAAEGREIRVRRVFEKYMELRRTNRTGGYDGLQKSGISTLRSNEEIQELFNLVVAHGEIHSLGPDHAKVFNGVDLRKFFLYATEKQVNFLKTPVEDVIRDSGAKT